MPVPVGYDQPWVGNKLMSTRPAGPVVRSALTHKSSQHITQVGRIVSVPREGAMLRLRPRDAGIGPLFEHIRDAAIVADLDTGMIRLWNPAAERLFGYTTSEALLLPVEVLVPERLRPRHLAGFASYRSSGHGALIDGGTPIEVPARRKTGEEITVELTLSPIEDSQI